MRKEKTEPMKMLVLKTLKEKGECGFRELFSFVSKPNPYYKRIGSMESLSKILKNLKEEGLIQQNSLTKKYKLTTFGGLVLGKEAIAEQILACRSLDTYSDWRSRHAYILVDGEEGCSSKVISVPYLRFQSKGLDWSREIKEAAQLEGLDYETEKEKVWKILFKGVRKVVLVEILEPWPLLEIEKPKK